MSPWRAVAAAGAALLFAGHATADVDIYKNKTAFTAFTDNSTNGTPSQTFRSSEIIAPVLQVNSWDKEHADDESYIFLGTVYNGKAGPMILDGKDLSLVYADQRYENAYFSSAQEIRGKRYLTFWEGRHGEGYGYGNCLVFDEKYELVYNVTAKGRGVGDGADLHEMKVTKNGTILVSTYHNVPFDCSSVGGPEDAMVMDSGFQEIDPETNKVVFEWSALDHFNLTNSLATYSEAYGVGPNTGFDFFHISSVDKTEDGDYLVSSRHMSSVVLVDAKSGKPIWILGGKQNQFRDLSDGNATNFGWQHDARMHGKHEISMFDNHGESTGLCKDNCKSRGLRLKIDTDAMTAAVVQEYYHPEGINSGAIGGMQEMDNGNVMVSWGYNPTFVEYLKNGTPVLDVQRGTIGDGYQSDLFAYRVSKHAWKGEPSWPPSIAVDAPNRTTLNASVFVSWNGATDIDKWAVLASDNTTTVSYYKNVIAESNRTGFETKIELNANVSRRYIGAAALSKEGDVLGSTFVIDMHTGQPVVLGSGITSIKPPVKAASVAAGAMGGSIFGVSMVFYAVNYFWKKKSLIPQSDGIHYGKVGSV